MAAGTQLSARTGRWFRNGRKIIVGRGDYVQSEIEEPSGHKFRLPRDIIDSRIDSGAQNALLRMFKGDQGAQADATKLLAAVKTGQLTGIYGDDLFAAVQIAGKLGTQRWLLVPKGEDAALVLDPQGPLTLPPVIVFRGDTPDIRAIPSRIDSAIRNASVSFRLWQTGQLSRCSGSLPEIRLSNVAPALFCRAAVADVLAPATARPVMRVSVLSISDRFQQSEIQVEGEVTESDKSDSEETTVVLFPGEVATVTAAATPRPDARPGYQWASSDPTVVDLFSPPPIVLKDKVVGGPNSHPNMAFITANQEGDAMISVETVYQNSDKVIGRLIVTASDLKIAPKDLEQAFSIKIQSGDKKWSQSELVDLHRALSLLSPGEEGVITGYTFLRRSSIESPNRGADACGRHVPRGLIIEVGDKCIRQPEFRSDVFIKREFKEGVPIGTFTILHEIGHAMDYSGVRSRTGTQISTTEFRQFDTPNRQLTDDRRTDPFERFPEAFAVFKANPDRLQRDFRRLFDWFRNRRHFRAGPYRN
jgi:hypothetical protein